jgi:ABC-type Na+ transport system ATPase subunit NatA
VEAMCPRIVLIDRGAIVTDTTQAELAARTPSGRLDDAFHALTRPDPAIVETAA